MWEDRQRDYQEEVRSEIGKITIKAQTLNEAQHMEALTPCNSRSCCTRVQKNNDGSSLYGLPGQSTLPDNHSCHPVASAFDLVASVAIMSAPHFVQAMLS